MGSSLYVKFKRLNEFAVMPTYANPGDAGLDLVAATNPIQEYFTDYVEYGTGLAAEIPHGYVGFIFPRSSISNYNLSLCNCVGVIDSGYRGEIRFRFTQMGSKLYKKGDKIGQLVIMPIPYVNPIEADELTPSIRGTGGYGSTGA